MAILADLDESERYLLSILQDQSGIDAAEFTWTDDTSPDLIYRCWDFQYCLGGETEFYTGGGVKMLKDCVGKVRLLTRDYLAAGGKVKNRGVWVNAEVRAFGRASVLSVVLGRRGESKVVRATAEHRWFVRDGGRCTETTTDLLQVGQRLQAVAVWTQRAEPWTVVDVVDRQEIDDVYCAVVPGTHSFVLDGDILTGNSWYRNESKFQIDLAGRAVGKSVGIQMRAFAFPFTHASEEMLITAPEMIHLDPVTKKVEDRIKSVRLGREFLKRSGTSDGFTHRPFEARFRNGARIIGRIPQKDGKGVKGQHPTKLELDEAQDYPQEGWVELGETLKFADIDATWRAHGVSRGVRDRYYKQTQPESGWFVHRITAMHRGDWTAEERDAKAELYGSRDHPDYRRNIYGLHGDSQSPLFVLFRLMQCVDQNRNSYYNTDEYVHIRINDEKLRDTGMAIANLMEFPIAHKAYARTWVGCDIGMTNHPTEILVFGEQMRSTKGAPIDGEPDMKLRCLARIHLERISSPDQRAAFEAIYEFYRPLGFALDRTGLGLPIYSEIMNPEGDPNINFQRSIRAYNFSSNLVVGYDKPKEDEPIDEDHPMGKPIMANVLEFSSDMLRVLVDKKQLILPWDIDMLREFQGQTYVLNKSTTNPYGKKQFSMGKYHALDACRMAVLAYQQEFIDQLAELLPAAEPVFDSFLI